jgi:hypothetical protein
MFKLMCFKPMKAMDVDRLGMVIVKHCLIIPEHY